MKMRRIGVCEERGSGYDKVVAQNEFYQLPARAIEIYDNHTKVILFACRPYAQKCIFGIFLCHGAQSFIAFGAKISTPRQPENGAV